MTVNSSFSSFISSVLFRVSRLWQLVSDYQDLVFAATDPTSSTGNDLGNRVGPGVVVGTFNISEQGDGGFPDLNRVILSPGQLFELSFLLKLSFAYIFVLTL